MLSKKFYDKKVVFIGSGNMAEAIVSGFVKYDMVKSSNIFCNDILQERLNYMAKKYTVSISHDKEKALNRIAENSRYVLYNSDITKDAIEPNMLRSKENKCFKFISYGYNSRANVTVSSVGDDEYLLFIQGNIPGYDMQEVRFNKADKNVNAYDGMITTIINLIYNDG